MARGDGDHLAALALKPEAGKYPHAHQKIAQHAPEQQHIPGSGELGGDAEGQVGRKQIAAGPGACQQQTERQDADTVAHIGHDPDPQSGTGGGRALVKGDPHDQIAAGKKLAAQQHDQDQSGGKGQGGQQLGQGQAGVVEPGGAQAGQQGPYKDEGPRHGGAGQIAQGLLPGQADLVGPGQGHGFHSGTCHAIGLLIIRVSIVAESGGNGNCAHSQSFFREGVSNRSKRCIIPILQFSTERNDRA